MSRRRRVIVTDPHDWRCPFCGQRRPPATLSRLLAEGITVVWREIGPRGRFLILSLWIFGIALALPPDLWLVTGTLGLLGSLALTAAIVRR